MKPYHFTLLYLSLCTLVTLFYSSLPMLLFSLSLLSLQLLLFLICRHLGLLPLSPSLLLSFPPSTFPNHCPSCLQPKPPRCYHCRECNLCRFRMDHHCHFLGVCIHGGNTKSYIMFLGVNLVYSLVSVGYLLGGVGEVFKRGEERMGLGKMAVGGLFGLMGCWRAWESWVLMRAQFEMMESNQTLVEILKKRRGRIQGFWQSWREVFGGRWWEWVNPWQTGFYSEITEDTYQVTEKKKPAGEEKEEKENIVKED